MSQAAADLAGAELALPPPLTGEVSAAWVPGRCTILGEHVDYAGGVVLCCALDVGVAAAIAGSDDGRWHVRSAGEHVVRDVLGGAPRGDIGDRPLAALEVAAREGMTLPPSVISLFASVPRSAGLSSSTAVICATLAAVLAGAGVQATPARFAELAWIAEHDLAGVPCGRLDQRAVVEALVGAVLELDMATGVSHSHRWPWPDVVLVIADSGERHDVAAPGYATLRRDADHVLQATGAASSQDLDPADVRRLDPRLRQRAQHLVEETERVRLGSAALQEADRGVLGGLMSAAHRAQRDQLRITTPGIDRMVIAAEAVEGCHGARSVGAGFGGSVVALCADAAAARCARAMLAAAPGTGAAWVTRPAGGLAALTPGLFVPGAPPEP
jgi:galactokinase